MRHLALILFATGLPLSAQTLNPVSYPQDTLTGSSGNLVPFGVLTPTSFAEGHTQLLFPADHLPSTGGALMGIAVNCQVASGALTYPSLNIDASLATVTTLSTTFANNVLAPQSVLAAQNLTITYAQAQWTPIMFTTPFIYGGSLNLVLDIRKVVTPPASGLFTMQTTGDPARNDLPRMVYAFGSVGSGASTATVGNIVAQTLQVRLLWAGIPTMTLKSDRSGGFSGNNFPIGGSIDITTYGTPSSLYLTQAGFSLTPVSIPPVAGLMYVSGVTLGIGFLNASGNDVRTLPIPGNPSLVGLHLAFQSGVLDAVSSMPQWTSASDCFINTP
jgi:hypothetical protein